MRVYQIIAAVAASLTATIGMAADAPQRFVHDGQIYEYQTAAGSGGRVISGRQLPGGTPFRLVVKNGRVTGTSGNTPVSFRVRDAQGASGGIADISN